MSNDTIRRAKAKIDGELESFKGDRYGDKLKQYVADALKSFCETEAFAERVLSSDETLATCVKEVVDTFSAKDVMSDFDVYARAAKFYFPECEVKFNMQLMPPDKKGDDTDEDIIDLLDFL